MSQLEKLALNDFSRSKALAERTRKSTQGNVSFWLASNWRFVWPPTCVDFGRAQIRTQVNVSFSPFGHPMQVDTQKSWLQVVKFTTFCKSVWPPFASPYGSSGFANLRRLALTCEYVWPGLNVREPSCYSIMVYPLNSLPNPKTNPSIHHNVRWGYMKYLLRTSRRMHVDNIWRNTRTGRGHQDSTARRVDNYDHNNEYKRPLFPEGVAKLTINYGLPIYTYKL